MPVDLAITDPTEWPVWLREQEIVTEGDHRGPYPGSSFRWRQVAPPAVKFGTNIACWHRNTVAELCHLPLPDDPEVAEESIERARAAWKERRSSRATVVA
jgi:hypothetical protein